MKLTIISDDRVVHKDGKAFFNIDMSQLDPNIHAIQWYDTWGEIEFKTVFIDNTLQKPNNQVISSISDYQWAIDAWEAANQEYESQSPLSIVPEES